MCIRDRNEQVQSWLNILKIEQMCIRDRLNSLHDIFSSLSSSFQLPLKLWRLERQEGALIEVEEKEEEEEQQQQQVAHRYGSFDSVWKLKSLITNHSFSLI